MNGMVIYFSSSFPEYLNKCSLTRGEDECQRVRLTIPREVCYPVERYHPYGGEYPSVAAPPYPYGARPAVQKKKLKKRRL